VAGVSDIVDIALANHHACALKNDASLWCWGSNYQRELGRGPDIDVAIDAEPKPVQGLGPIIAFDVGYEASCAVTDDGLVHRWGDIGGVLDDSDRPGGSGSSTPTPVTVPYVSDAMKLAVGVYVGNIGTETGSMHCWGIATNGATGNGTKGMQFDTSGKPGVWDEG
jgi:alpha-tubulin suppressor-like RCC1 family protein